MAIIFSVRLKPNRARPAREGQNPDVLPGAGRCLVFLIHGLTGSPAEMRFLAHFFNTKKGYTVVCPVLAHHGESIYALKKMSWQELYGSVRTRFRDVLASSTGSVFVAGLSVGALLALLLAHEFRRAIAGISCLSPTLFYDGWSMPWYRRLLPLACATPLKHFLYFKEGPPYGIKNRLLQNRLHLQYSAATLDGDGGIDRYGYCYYPVTLLQEHRRMVRDILKKLPDIDVPVQILQARHDDMASVKNATLIYDKISSAVREIVLLDNSYHVITVDQERSTVAEKIAAFHSRIAPGACAPEETADTGNYVPDR